MLVAMLGILKASGCYVPLDPEHPRARLAYVLEDSGIELIVTRALLMETLPLSAGEGAGRTIACELLDGDAEAGGCHADDPARIAAPDNLAYVIYTARSNGRPKGVRVTHTNCVNFLE